MVMVDVAENGSELPAPAAVAEKLSAAGKPTRNLEPETDVRPLASDAGYHQQVAVRLEVVWGDVGRVDAAVVAVGHYEGVYPTAAEAAVDRALSDQSDGDQRLLYQATARGALTGALGEVNLYPWPRPGQEHGMAAVLGLGRPGTFGLAQHEVVVRNLLWTVDRMVRGTTLAGVLVGAGARNLTIRQTVESFVRSLDVAVRQRELTGGITTIRLVEHELGRARLIHSVLSEIVAQRDAKAPAIIDLAPIGECDDGVVSEETALGELLVAASGEPHEVGVLMRQRGDSETMSDAVDERLKELRSIGRHDFEVRRPPNAEGADAPTRYSILVRDGELRVAAISDAATVSERPLGLDVELFKALVEQANTEAAGDLESAGELLVRLAVPDDFRPFLRQKRSMVLEVDPVTAGIPWEVLKVGVPMAPGPMFLGLSTPLARQLRTTLSPPPVVTGHVALRRVLVIGDPGVPGGGGELPGAREEAQAVVTLLRRHNVEVHHLVGADGGGSGETPATLPNVLHRLLHWEYDIVHYAGHGTFSSTDAGANGWMLADGLLKGTHLEMVERLPPLLVANACHSGRVSTGLPGLADEFMGRGVRNLLGTARAVDDASAKAFSATFYATLLGTVGRPDDPCRSTLGSAVLAGRRHLTDAGRPDWDAYQLYGDPEFRFWGTGATSPSVPNRRQSQPIPDGGS